MASGLPRVSPQDMRALVVEGASVVRVSTRPRPDVARDDDVVVRVAYAGVCRTDLRVARGELSVPAGRVFGHELSGVVERAGATASAWVGARVTVDPYVACRRCRACLRGDRCAAPEMIGLERDGAFATHLRVPASALVQLPDAVSLAAGAFTEPVAATLAIVRAPIRTSERGVVVGRGRVAQLAFDVLRVLGFANVDRVRRGAEGEGACEDGAYDFAVETSLTDDTLALAARLVRPGGRIVVKSRPSGRVAVDFAPLLRRELTLSHVWYGDFTEAAALLPALEAEARFAPAGGLEEYERVLGLDRAKVGAGAEDDGDKKGLFTIGGEA